MLEGRMGFNSHLDKPSPGPEASVLGMGGRAELGWRSPRCLLQNGTCNEASAAEGLRLEKQGLQLAAQASLPAAEPLIRLALHL